MAIPDAAHSALRISAVLAESFTAFWRNPLTFATLALLLALPVMIVDYSLLSAPVWLQWVIFVPASIAIAGVFGGMVVCGVALDRKRGRTTLRECIGYGSAFAIPAAAVSILELLLACIGLLLFVFPGIFLIVRLFVVIPVMVIERPGFYSSLRRSVDLTGGAGWHVFGILVAIELAFYLADVVASYIPAEAFGAFAIGWALVAARALTIGLVASVTYFHLRDMREGNEPSQIAEIFD